MSSDCCHLKAVISGNAVTLVVFSPEFGQFAVDANYDFRFQSL